MNENIQSNSVRIVTDNGQQILSKEDALNLAIEKGLDLVLVSEANPPVCKLLDSGKYLFEMKKKEKKNKQNQKVTEIKEIRMSPSIGKNDYLTKLKSAISFLEKGANVKVSIQFRGREITHKNIGEKVLNEFCQDISHVGTFENKAALQGRMLTIILKPKQAS
jgi:translation initiation factor IF-3